MTIGKGRTPFVANVNAHKSRQAKEALTTVASIFGHRVMYSSNDSHTEFSLSKSTLAPSLNGDLYRLCT